MALVTKSHNSPAFAGAGLAPQDASGAAGDGAQAVGCTLLDLGVLIRLLARLNQNAADGDSSGQGLDHSAIQAAILQDGKLCAVFVVRHKPRCRWPGLEYVELLAARRWIAPGVTEANNGKPRLDCARAVGDLDPARVAIEYLAATVVNVNFR